jgi:hypothetical protein
MFKIEIIPISGLLQVEKRVWRSQRTQTLLHAGRRLLQKLLTDALWIIVT